MAAPAYKPQPPAELVEQLAAEVEFLAGLPGHPDAVISRQRISRAREKAPGALSEAVALAADHGRISDLSAHLVVEPELGEPIAQLLEMGLLEAFLDTAGVRRFRVAKEGRGGR